MPFLRRSETDQLWSERAVGVGQQRWHTSFVSSVLPCPNVRPALFTPNTCCWGRRGPSPEGALGVNLLLIPAALRWAHEVGAVCFCSHAVCSRIARGLVCLQGNHAGTMWAQGLPEPPTIATNRQTKAPTPERCLFATMASGPTFGSQRSFVGRCHPLSHAQ